MIEVRYLRIQRNRLCKVFPRLRRVVCELALALAEIKQRRSVVADEQEILEAIVIEVGEKGFSHAPVRGGQAGGAGHLRKRAIAVVAVETNGSTRKIVRKEERIFLRRRIQVGVCGDNQVQEAVVVRVEQHRAGVQFSGRRAQSGLLRLVRECAVTVVPVHADAVEAGEKETALPAVVVIGERGRKAGPGPATPAFSVTSLNVPSPLLWKR